MKKISHKELVKNLKKDPKQIIEELTPEKADAWHMASALCGEAGELFDCIKKYVIYNKEELDRTNLIEEMGDVEFYMEGLRQIFSISREETIDENINKVSQRYKTLKYSNEQAKQRADKI